MGIKDKITQLDSFALNISDAYTHKTVLGGIFSIFYVLLGFGIVIALIYKYATQPDQISTKVLYDYNLPIAEPDPNSFNVSIQITLSKGTNDDIKTFISYFRFYIAVELASGKRSFHLTPCNITNSQPTCSIKLPFSAFDESKALPDIKRNSFQLGLITCKELKSLEDQGLVIVTNKELYEGCQYTYDIFNYEWMKDNILEYKYYLLHHYFEYPEISDQLTIKEYVIKNKLSPSLHERYSMDMNYANIIYDNYLFFGSKSDKTILNWIDPEKITQGKRGDGHSLTIIFSNRFKTRVFYYSIMKESFSTVLINLGGLLKIYGLLTFIPYLWNNYYREKALLVLCTMFSFKSLNLGFDEEEEKKKRSNTKTSEMDHALIEKEGVEGFDWHKYNYCLYIKTKYFGCCVPEIKKMKDKILNSLECTSFVKFGASKKWVDIAKFMPCYVRED